MASITHYPLYSPSVTDLWDLDMLIKSVLNSWKMNFFITDNTNSTGWGKSSFTGASAQNTEFILVLLLINYGTFPYKQL